MVLEVFCFFLAENDPSVSNNLFSDLIFCMEANKGKTDRDQL
jgi:hypothetical protein